MVFSFPSFFFFFFNDTATTEIYTLSLHDALPILPTFITPGRPGPIGASGTPACSRRGDRKSTRLNSSHSQISYAVFCLKKKKKTKHHKHATDGRRLNTKHTSTPVLPHSPHTPQ